MNDDLVRWRLVLGQAASSALDGPAGPDATALARDAALDWLYGRDTGLAERDERGADLGPSALTTVGWVNGVHRLFPKEAIERLQRDAIEEFGLHEVVTSKEVLRHVQPSETLLRAILQTKALMDPDVLAMARELVAKVVRELVRQLATEVRIAFGGSRPTVRTRHPVGARFAALETIRANLHRWDPERRRLLVDRPRFRKAARKDALRWQLVLLVDQSGSMVDSVIHSAVTASCLWRLPSFTTHLLAFDTSVVDLTSHVRDPIELLMGVQLGGGTDIAGAVRYAETLLREPRRSVVVIVSDFYEGGDGAALVRTVQRMTGAGAKVLGLAALDRRAEPVYDAVLARRLVQAGAEVGAMTPGELVGWLSRILR